MKVKTIVIKFLLPLTVITFISIYPKSVNALTKREFKKRYYFQHKLLPRWTHRSRGKFFKAMMNNDFRVFNRAAKKILGTEYAEKIKVKLYTDLNAFLIIFPKPGKIPLCYFVYIVKQGDNYRYFTYEKTYGHFVRGAVGVVCEWTAGLTHRTLGTRKYNDADSFVKELKILLNN